MSTQSNAHEEDISLIIDDTKKNVMHDSADVAGAVGGVRGIEEREGADGQTSDMCSETGILRSERRILIIGKTGVGKSTTANTILNKNAFSCTVSAKSVTKATTYATATRFGRKLVVVDSPGLCDTDSQYSDESVIEEIKKFYGMTAPGLHAILLVVYIGRITKKDEKMVKKFLKHFGEEIKPFLIVVFTNKDSLDENNDTIEEYIKSFKTDSAFRELLPEIEDRYVVFGYKKKEKEEREAEVKELLDMIESLAKTNQSFFSNETYREAERLIEEELLRRKEREAREMLQKKEKKELKMLHKKEKEELEWRQREEKEAHRKARRVPDVMMLETEEKLRENEEMPRMELEGQQNEAVARRERVREDIYKKSCTIL